MRRRVGASLYTLLFDFQYIGWDFTLEEYLLFCYVKTLMFLTYCGICGRIEKDAGM